jgi:hypothetical protein
MSSPQSLAVEAEGFANDYAAHFSSPKCSSPKEIPEIAEQISKFYRPGMTFFTNGHITRFEVR